MQGGYTRGVAQWMATNLVRGERADSCGVSTSTRWSGSCATSSRTDLWHVVESPGAEHDIHFVKASESSAISETAVTRLEAASAERVHLHQRQGGHWIHAESPQVITDLLVEYLPR